MKKVLIAFSFLFAFVGLVACGQATTTTTTAAFDTSSTINVYTRDTTSGTREAFFKGIGYDDAVKDNTLLVSTYVEVASNGAMVTSIQNDKYGIGYISLASLPGTGLVGLDFNGVQATQENVLNGTYGLQRPFNYITRADYTGRETQGQIVQAFIAFMGTVEGKAIIANDNGILTTTGNEPLWSSIASNYPVCSQDNSAVTVQFGGSTSVEPIARALSAAFSPLCGDFTPEHNHTGSGDAYKRTQGSEADGSNALDLGFASRAFDYTTTEPYATGTTGQICLDAVVIVVNGDNNLLANITTDAIKKIYDGEITVWSGVNS